MMQRQDVELNRPRRSRSVTPVQRLTGASGRKEKLLDSNQRPRIKYGRMDQPGGAEQSSRVAAVQLCLIQKQ